MSAAMSERLSFEEEALLDAIADAPDDDQPRLVYADWLLDRGEVRGELIHLQCLLERMPDDDLRGEAMARQVEALVATHRERWCGGLKDYEHSVFHRGFLRAYSISTRTLLRHPERVWRLSPFRSVRLDSNGEATELPACSVLARYRKLSVTDSLCRDCGLGRLAHSPYLEALEELELESCFIDDEAFLALTRSPYLAKLRWLGIGLRGKDFALEDSLSAAGFCAIAGAPFAPHLDTLNLRGRTLAAESVQALAALPKLTTLDLRSTRIGSEGAIRLAALPLRLRSLILDSNRIGDEGVLALGSSAVLDGIEVLDVSSNGFSETAGVTLVRSPQLRSLRYLGYEGMSAGGRPEVAGAIASSLPQLSSLNMSFGRIGPEGAAALAAGDLPHLESLTLFCCGVTDSGAVALARSTTLPALRSLDLSENGITDAGAIALAESPHLEGLRYLRIRSTTLGRKAVDALRTRFGRRVDVKDPPEG